RNGIRSVQSTPLLTRDGALIGMMSTHWRIPHEPSERDLQLFDVLARQVADLIERIRAETALRTNQKRQAFLLELHDALRTLAEPAEIQETAARLLGEHLRVQRVNYTEIEGEFAHIKGSYVNGVRPLPPHVAYRAFGTQLIERYQRGESVTVDDIETSPLFGPEEREALREIEVCAFVVLVLIKDGRWVAAFAVQSATPRVWKELEISLVQETAERTWAAVERARAEQALRDSEARLRDMDRRKDEFLATLAHELRNPLAPIRNSLNILRVSGSEAKAPEAILDILERQVDHMVRLVDDLMEVSRITRGQIELRKERIDLVTVVRSAVETSRPLIEAARHDLVLDLPEEPLPLEADPVRVAQVLSNLLNNSA
ncbi:MAG TPA: GAF domain-containing sensor histidine kinase, partial [Candidatus Eisenbacteria bacterium]|nr:GAF domain-containing sensor histidine kinase [Candidatus Eisenbacteria bacterium]